MAKKWLFSAALIIGSFAFSSFSSAQNMRPAAPEIAAKAWILIDADTGTVLLENNADEQQFESRELFMERRELFSRFKRCELLGSEMDILAFDILHSDV